MARETFERLLLVAALGALLLACALAPQGQLNAPQFAVRPPVPGRPGYLETIRYIDDGLRYVAPDSAFFVSPDGRMCFRGLLNVERIEFQYDRDWCLRPVAVSRVEDVRNGTTDVPEMLLWCKHGYPDCVRDIAALRRATNFALVEILPAAEEKRAIEHLIYLMGGQLGEDRPFAQSVPLRQPWSEPPER